MSMGNDIPKTALSNPDIKLFCKNSEDKWASLQFRTITTGRKYDDNVLEATVWTNETADADKSIAVKMDIITVGLFLQNIKAAIESKEEEFVAPVIEFEQTRWVKDGGRRKPDGVFVAAKLHVGKDKEGRVWTAITATKPGRPNLKFVFHTNKTRHLANRDGSRLNPAQISVYAAQSYYTLLSKMVYQIMVNGYREPEAAPQQGGNGGYGNNNGGGYQSQPRQQQAAPAQSGGGMDDDTGDLPF